MYFRIVNKTISSYGVIKALLRLLYIYKANLEIHGIFQAQLVLSMSAVDWYKQTLKTSNIKEDTIQIEAVNFIDDHLTKGNKRKI